MFLMDIINKNSDDKLKDLIGESKLEMPFSDFEERLMSRVNSELRDEKSISRNIRLSWLFFGLGTTFGLLLSVILSSEKEIMGILLGKLIMPLYIIGGIVILLFAEQLIKLTINHKKHHQIN